MAPFKKKKKDVPALYFTLNKDLEEARNAKKDYFYCPLLEGEETLAYAWCVTHHMWMKISHKNGNTNVYKFYGA